MPDNHGIDGQWERVASELRACRQAQQQAWGDLDNATLGRYLADDVTPEERRHIEAALNERPELRKLTDLVSDVLRDCEPASAPQTAAHPAVLPFRKPTSTPKTTTRRWRQWTAVAAAACLLLALGYTRVLPMAGPTPAPLPGGDVAAAPDRDAGVKSVVAFHVPLPGCAGPADHTPAPALALADANKGGAGPEAEAKAAELAIPDPVVLACADGLNWAGEHLQQAGDLDKAEWSYSLAHKIQVWKLGPDAPPTVETRQKLGDLYQVALNTPDAKSTIDPAKLTTSPASPSATEIHRPVYAFDQEKDEQPIQNGANQLRERITRQPPAALRKSVAPILVQNLREAQTSQVREQLGRALAELGPAANAAVPVLEECLAKAKSPEERAVVLRALGEMGPAAGANAAPVLVTSLKSPSPVVRRAAEEALLQYGPAAHDALNQARDADDSPAGRAEWENAKNRILGAEGRVGVHDPGERFSLLALKEGRRAIRELARDYNVEVLAETEAPADRPEDKAAAKDRAREVGANGVCFVIHRSPVRVEVWVGQALRAQGFDEKQQEGLRQAVETELSRQDYDQGLLEGVRYVARFQAERADEAAPAKP